MDVRDHHALHVADGEPGLLEAAAQRVERVVGVPARVDEVRAPVGLERVDEHVAEHDRERHRDAPQARAHLFDGEGACAARPRERSWREASHSDSTPDNAERVGDSMCRVMGDGTTRQYRLISADSHVNEPPDLWTSRVAVAIRRPRAAHRVVRAGRRVGPRGRGRPDQLRHERVRGPATRGDDGLEALRRDPPRRLRPRGAPRRDGRGRRRRRGALPDAAPVASGVRLHRRRLPRTRWCRPTTTGSRSTSGTSRRGSPVSRCCRTAAPTTAHRRDRAGR